MGRVVVPFVDRLNPRECRVHVRSIPLWVRSILRDIQIQDYHTCNRCVAETVEENKIEVETEVE